MRNISRKWSYLFLILSMVIANGCEESNETPANVTDIEGNTYKTVKIGSQIWMAENLKTTKYRNGDLIGTTSSATKDIRGEVYPQYQWAYGGNESNVNTYGRLYTYWSLIDNRKVCPTGFHLPTDDEWTTLVNYLGGYRLHTGQYGEIGNVGVWWSIPAMGVQQSGSWFRYIVSYNSEVFRSGDNSPFGYSVRCIKD